MFFLVKQFVRRQFELIGALRRRQAKQASLRGAAA